MDPQTIISDICQTLNRNPGCIEIAEAGIGGSAFNQAKYFPFFTVNDYSKSVAKKKNVVWLNGINLSPEILNKDTKRKAKDQHIKSRNILVFDIDFKEADSSFADQGNDYKEKYAQDVFEENKESLLKAVPGLWMVVFSGNGIHLYVRLEKPLAVRDSKTYSRTYEKIARHIQTEGFKDRYILDDSCKNPARIMRLPYSTNYKNAHKPIQTKAIYFDENGYSDNFIQNLPEKKPIEPVLKTNRLKTSHSVLGGDHKENLRKSLTFKMILDRYYLKGSTITTEGGGELKCSSPFKDDRTPSCFLNEDKKVFKCHSSGHEGDVFEFLGLIANEQTFPKILRLAEELTGIISPKDNNVTHLKAVDQPSPSPSRGKKEEPSWGEYVGFFDRHLPQAARCLLSGQCMTFHGGKWVPVKSREDFLESHAIESEYFKKSHIKPHLARYSETKEKRLLIDIPPWDGTDWIKAMVSCLKINNVSTEVAEYFVKKWLSKMFGRAENPKNQNQVLIFTGPQGIGKDVFIDSLVGGLGQFKSNLSMDSREKETDAVLADNLVLNISEFDRTKSMNVSYLKDMVTSPQKTFRRPYERVPQQHDLRCSFIASCNITDILRDHTGNRRYTILNVESIDWKYQRDKSLQILAQGKQLYKDGFKEDEAAEAAMKAFILSQTPDDPDQAILEYCDETVFMDYRERKLDEVKGKFSEIQKLFGLKSITHIQKVLRAHGRSKKTNAGVVYFKPRMTL